MLLPTRRRLKGATAPGAAARPRMLDRSGTSELAPLLAAFDELRALEDTDLILRRAIELLRDRIGLKRAGIFLLDRSRDLMLGTWGMDLSCAVVDEHGVTYEMCEPDREALRRAEEEEEHFTVFENCPIVEHQDGDTRIAGRGWVARTPIRSPHAPIGVLFNDGGLTGAPVDEVRQAQAAVICALLGTMLDPRRGGLGRGVARVESRSEWLVSSTLAMLDKAPGMGGKEIAAALRISVSRLARVFKGQMGMSLVEYRNRLRLDRFAALLDGGRSNLFKAALDAGFGSYAQFHRVFRARLHAAPRQYLRPSAARLPRR